MNHLNRSNKADELKLEELDNVSGGARFLDVIKGAIAAIRKVVDAVTH
jgi:hypothetical protein